MPFIRGGTLGEWLNEKEMRAGKDKEAREKSILAVIGEQGPNFTNHIDRVWLHPKERARIKSGDAQQFREELFALIKACDGRWPSERYWARGVQLSKTELKPYAKLAKYLNGIRLWPRKPEGEGWPKNIGWILSPAGGGFFNRDTMLSPLRDLVVAKTSRYANTKTGFAELVLLLISLAGHILRELRHKPRHILAQRVREAERARSICSRWLLCSADGGAKASSSDGRMRLDPKTRKTHGPRAAAAAAETLRRTKRLRRRQVAAADDPVRCQCLADK
jgi:hypothetical protein